MDLLLTLTLCFLIGSGTAYFANQRGRDPFIWFMIGLFLGIFGLILLFLLPPVQPTSDGESSVETIPAEEKSSVPQPIGHDYLIKEWFYYDQQRERQGPVRFETLKEMWKQGALTEESFVWSEGMTEWQRVEEVRGLYTHLQLGS